MRLLSLLTAILLGAALAAQARAQLVFSFEGGATADGFTLLQAPDSTTTWVSSAEVIDAGDGFNVLAASHGADRVVVTPYFHRDNHGGAGNMNKAMILRSPTFQLSTGSLAVDMLGGKQYGENNPGDVAQGNPVHAGQLGSMQRNTGYDFIGAGETSDGKYMQGFALRDALTGEYVLIGAGNVLNDGKARPTDPPERGVWETVSFTPAQLAPFANNGRKYQIDFIDSFGASSWAHIGFDNLRVPGTLSSFAKGDANGDGSTNVADSAIVFGNFTGWRSPVPMAKADGLARDDGDFDGNGDVDGGDVLEHIANIGLNSPSIGQAQLLYDPADGSLTFDASGAPGGKITGFRLTSAAAAPFLPGFATLPSVGTPISTDIAEELFWADTTLTGFTGTVDLGSILSSGLTLAQAQESLSSVTYVGAVGTGEQSLVLSLAGAAAGDFNGDGFVNGADLDDPVFGWKARFGADLDGSDFLSWQRNFGAGGGAAAAIPEPSTALLAAIGGLAVVRLRRRLNGEK